MVDLKAQVAFSSDALRIIMFKLTEQKYLIY